ncbi:MFS transporter [Ahrensia marina]|uniref:MFS transporter n=1 Tax=Ahrensia marina TaxID=1514904 RepID=UPI0035CF1767
MDDEPITRGAVAYIGLLAANTILSSAMPMLIILGGLAGLMLSPSPALATFPASVQVFAGLLATGPFSMVMGRFGRRAGFCAGGLLAAAGGLACAWALVEGSFAMLCAGHAALGAALACYQYFRFAAAEVVPPAWSPVAISLMLTSGLVAAFFGPQLFIWTKDALAPIPFAGAYLAISAISLAGLVPLTFVRLLRPTSAGRQSTGLPALSVLLQPGIATAMAMGAVSQGVMVFMMAPTPLAMIECGFSESIAGDVIRWHVVAMFAPSFLTGFVIKRIGAKAVVAAGLLLLAVAALVAAAGLSGAHFYVSLIALGVGWNFGFIGATAMLAERVAPADRALVQGANDTIIALCATISTLAAGAIVTGPGWTFLAAASLPVVAATALVLLFVRSTARAAG